jgi:hypothetical protein
MIEKSSKNSLAAESCLALPVRHSLPALMRSPASGLTINQPGDPYEQEADRVADRVMRMPAPVTVQRRCTTCDEEEHKLQRKCAQCEEEEKNKLHRKACPESTQMETGAAHSKAPAIVHEVLRSSGQPLDPATRSFMEPRFGHDFSRIRVHDDDQAAQSARAVNARAYTVGPSVVFGAGEYAPGSEYGRRLLAHELAHVVQQSKDHSPVSQVQRWTIDNCSTSQQYYIEDAITRAYSDLTTALSLVQQRPVPDRVKNALWLAFRDDSDATADLALNNVKLLHKQITGTHFACSDKGADSDCDENLAYAPIGKPQGIVTICRPQFFAADMSMFDQSETVVHEAAHMYVSMRDRGYFAQHANLCAETAHPSGTFDPAAAKSGTAGDNPAIRLENADSYGCLVHYLRYLDPAALQSRSAAYRGDNLSIVGLDDMMSELYTRATIPQLHRYGIRGAPENSGFQYRWRLQAGTVSYNPATSGRGSASAFAEDNLEVYFDSDLTKRLEADHVTKVTLVCEMQVFGAYGDRFAPPVITKNRDLTVVFGPPPFDL